MNEFTLTQNGNTVSYSDMDKLLIALETLLLLKQRPTVSVAKGAVAAIAAVADLLKRHGIEIVLTVDSDPQAIDYVVHALLGGAVGATAAGGVAGVVLVLAARFGYHIPYVGWVISLAAMGGLAFGATTGLAVTRMGLRAKFSLVNKGFVDLEFLPAAA